MWEVVELPSTAAHWVSAALLHSSLEIKLEGLKPWYLQCNCPESVSIASVCGWGAWFVSGCCDMDLFPQPSSSGPWHGPAEAVRRIPALQDRPPCNYKDKWFELMLLFLSGFPSTETVTATPGCKLLLLYNSKKTSHLFSGGEYWFIQLVSWSVGWFGLEWRRQHQITGGY